MEAGAHESGSEFPTNEEPFGTNTDDEDMETDDEESKSNAKDSDDDNTVDFGSMEDPNPTSGSTDSGSGISGQTATPNTEMLSKFRAYCTNHAHNFLPLSKEDITSIKLLYALKHQKTPLSAYKKTMEWHLHETKHLLPHKTIKDTDN